MKATIRLHVPRIGADYEWASVVINGHEYVRYGDYYHDKGADKAEGYALGFAQGHGLSEELEIVREEFHDPACYEYDEGDGYEH